MRFLIFCVALLGCDMPKMGSFYNLQAGERNPYSPEPEDPFCGVCVGYRNSTNPFEIYLFLEDCEFLSMEVQEEYCYRDESKCFASCLPRDYNCTEPTKNEFCE